MKLECVKYLKLIVCLSCWGTGITGLMRGMATLPKATRSYLWSKTKLEDPRWAWGEQVRGMRYFLPSVLWHCRLGDRKGIRPVKNWTLVVMIWVELWMAYSSSCHHLFHHPLLEWTPANPSSPGRWLLKWRESVSPVFCAFVLLSLWLINEIRKANDKKRIPIFQNTCPMH